MIFNKIIKVEDILLGEHEILTEVKHDSKSNIIIPDSGEGFKEDSNDYAVIIAIGDSVDEERYAIGNVILAINGRGSKSFDYHKKKYVIFSSHSVGVMVTPDNFLPTKNKK